MNAGEPTTGPVRQARYAGLLTWLAGRQRGRWATRRGRWIKTVLTAALIVTGLTAWAVALVQPWTGHRGDPGDVALGSSVDVEKLRQASAEVQKIVREYVPPVLKPLRRNPFEGAGPAAAESAAPAVVAAPAPPARPPDETASPAKLAPAAAPPSGRPTPPKVLETLRGLKLEIVVATPAGERWAVINGETYREGDTVAGLEIVEIQDGRVKLQQAGTTCLLRMD
jgi:hypothetical protein